MSNEKENIRMETDNKLQEKSVHLYREVIVRIKELQSIPEEVVIEFLKSQGSISRLSYGKEE